MAREARRLSDWLRTHASHGGSVRIGASALCRCGMVAQLDDDPTPREEPRA